MTRRKAKGTGNMDRCEDYHLEAAYEARYDAISYYEDGYGDDRADLNEGYYDSDDEDDEGDPGEVNNDFPMSLEYEGPFGLSGYDDYGQGDGFFD